MNCRNASGKSGSCDSVLASDCVPSRCSAMVKPSRRGVPSTVPSPPDRTASDYRGKLRRAAVLAFSVPGRKAEHTIAARYMEGVEMDYAVVLGEALIDLLESDHDGELIYRQAIGGAPLNVAVGATRLGGNVQFVGSLGNDTLGDRIAAFLRKVDVGTTGLKRVPVPTT